PPLRSRPKHTGPLARHWCSALTDERKPRMALDDSAVSLLQTAPWPGNVRQLQNFVERLTVFSKGPLISAADVERELSREANGPSEVPGTPATLDSRRRQSERDALQDALARAEGNRTTAARLLGISRRTLYNKLAEHGIGW